MKELAQALANVPSTGGLVLHLVGVQFIDCACAEIIARAARARQPAGRPVIHASPAVWRVFQLSGLAAGLVMDITPGPPGGGDPRIPGQRPPARAEAHPAAPLRG